MPLLLFMSEESLGSEYSDENSVNSKESYIASSDNMSPLVSRSVSSDEDSVGTDISSYDIPPLMPRSVSSAENSVDSDNLFDTLPSLISRKDSANSDNSIDMLHILLSWKKANEGEITFAVVLEREEEAVPNEVLSATQ